MTGPSAPAAATSSDYLCRQLLGHGFELFAGVPCSFLAGLFALLQRRYPDRYVAAANEGAALAVACGATLAGRRSAVLIQNSGLGNLVNPLASLASTFDIPVLLIIGYRGDPAGKPDEPQHALMGRATTSILDALGVAHRRLPATEDAAGAVLAWAGVEVAAGRTAAILVGRGVICDPPEQPPADETSGQTAAEDADAIDPVAALTRLSGLLRDELVVATTGYASRRLFAYGDRPGNFYMQGSMGHAISIGLGLALSRPDRRVVVVDGDGAALMHLGALATVGARAPANLTHLVLDNGRYESTGGQPTESERVDFEAVARACGYRHMAGCRSAGQLDERLAAALRAPGPALLHVRVATSPVSPPRATASLSPHELRRRFAAQAGGASHPEPGPTDAPAGGIEAAGPDAGQPPAPATPGQGDEARAHRS